MFIFFSSGLQLHFVPITPSVMNEKLCFCSTLWAENFSTCINGQQPENNCPKSISAHGDRCSETKKNWMRRRANAGSVVFLIRQKLLFKCTPACETVRSIQWFFALGRFGGRMKKLRITTASGKVFDRMRCGHAVSRAECNELSHSWHEQRIYYKHQPCDGINIFGALLSLQEKKRI